MPPEPDPFAPVRAAANASGGFCHEMTNHVAALLPCAGQRLVVSFDNLVSPKAEGARMPWGHEFLARQGWDVLGIMARRADWFRHPDLWDFFDRLRDEGFFRRYQAVSMYGASMGGFGALTFAAAAPGCTVLAMAPQSTLAPRLTPFEHRFRYACRHHDWTGRYADAAEGVRTAGRAYVLFDPMEQADAAHAARLDGPNVTLLRLPHAGHKLPPALRRMGLLKDVALPALTGGLEPSGFYRLYRQRRNSVPWLVNLLAHARQRGHLDAGLRLADTLLETRPHFKLRKERRALQAALDARNSPPET